MASSPGGGRLMRPVARLGANWRALLGVVAFGFVLASGVTIARDQGAPQASAAPNDPAADQAAADANAAMAAANSAANSAMEASNAAAAAAIPDWTDTLSASGWLHLADTQDAVTYTRPFVGGKRLWVRWEYHYAQGAYPKYLSAVELDEADCAGRRARVIQTTVYPSNNLDGEATSSGAQAPSAWTFEIPDTIGDAILNRICRAPHLLPPAKRKAHR